MSDKTYDADAMEDHNTFDMGSTTVGAPLRQETYNPSLHFRRFAPGEARGISTKRYLPDPLNGIRLRLLSRVRSSDEPVLPVTPGNMALWIGIRDNPDFQWRFHKIVQAHPSQHLTDWRSWTIDMPWFDVLRPMNVFANSWVQLSVVRKGDSVLDTAADTYWDLMMLNVEVY